MDKALSGSEGQSPGITAEEVAEDVFLEILSDAVGAVEAAGVPYVLMGGFASAAHGRPRWTHDIDFFVKREDARRVLEVLAARGFATEETDQGWIYKAFKKGVMVDAIFCSADDIRLDDEMLARAHRTEFKGVGLQVIPPEDLLNIKARVFKEPTPRHWFDALGIIRESELDWDYLVAKARDRPEKTLSLLLFARASGLQVPHSALQQLWEATARLEQAPARAADSEDEYLAAKIHERLADAGFEVDVSVVDGVVTLAGQETATARRGEISRLASALAPGRRVVNQLMVASLDEPEEVEQVT